MARVDFGGCSEACLDYVPEARVRLLSSMSALHQLVERKEAETLTCSNDFQ
jgi:hypothetical protein